MNPTTTPPSYWQSPDIAANADATAFKNAIGDYYYKTYNSNIDVTLKMFDALNNVTTNVTNATTYTYTVLVRRMINGLSINAITVTNVNSKSTISVVPPSKGI